LIRRRYLGETVGVRVTRGGRKGVGEEVAVTVGVTVGVGVQLGIGVGVRVALAVGDRVSDGVSEAVAGDVAEGALVGAMVGVLEGARVRVARIEDLRHSLDIWSAALATSEGPSFAELMGEGVPIRAGRELLKWFVGRSDHTLPAIGLALVEKLPGLLGERTARAIEIGSRLKQQFATEIGERGIMLYPSYPKLAPLHGTALLPPIQFTYTAVLNITEMPVTQVPLGLHRGLPLGVQVAALPGNDHLTIAAALELERAFGGWVPPPRWFVRSAV
jgi:fatty acid amide hydrolase 2